MITATPALSGILFCDVVGSTQLYRDLGDDSALVVISACLATISNQIAGRKGRVVKTIGDEIMAIFPDAVSAYDAAVTIQRSCSVDPGHRRSDQKEVHFRIGFHCGPVILCDGDVFGTTVNIAARLASLAKADQIITTALTIEQLDRARRATTRVIAAHARGLGDLVVAEVVWNPSGVTETVIFPQAGSTSLPSSPGVLRIVYDGRRSVFGQDCGSLTLGRAPDNTVVILSQFASRRHATIEQRWGRWVLIDHSTNGTFVRPAGNTEVCICCEEAILYSAGSLSLGRSCQDENEADIHFVLSPGF